MRDVDAMWKQVEPNWRQAPPQMRVFPPYPCSYLPGRSWQLLAVYDEDIDRLMALGGQRFGSDYCLPLCAHCRACRPSRIDVASFELSRSQKRTQRKNRGLQTSIEPARFRPETYQLFCSYVEKRFGTDTSTYRTELEKRRFYEAWMIHHYEKTFEVHYRDGDHLLAVSLLDIGRAGLYAHYLYYDTSVPKRRLGIATILEEIDLCRRLGRKHLYLGFSNRQAPTMRYKDQFSGLELLLPERGWIPAHPLDRSEAEGEPGPHPVEQRDPGRAAATYPAALPRK